MKHKPKIRYYLWTLAGSYGWRSFGASDGYSSLREAKRDLRKEVEFDKEHPPRSYKRDYIVLKAKPFQFITP